LSPQIKGAVNLSRTAAEDREGDKMNKTRLWAILGLLGVLAVAITAAGCGDDNGGGGGNAETKEAGKLIVGSDIPYPPFEQGRAPNYEGIDIELVDAIAKDLKLDVQWEDTSFDTIFRDLAAGKFDMVASASTITPEREKTVGFSDGYFPADQSLMIKKGSDIKTIDDVSGQIVGAQKGTTGADFAENETDAKTVRTYGEIADAFNALEAGQVEAVINDCPVSKYAERSYPDLQVIEALTTDETYGFAFQKGSTDLEDSVNGALKKIEDDGTYDKIIDKWLGKQPCKSITTE
jgi:polar amino acid transport system substrate-binding protein